MEQQQQESSVSCFNGINSLLHSFPAINRLDWVIDTGATHHICCSMSLFQTFRPITSKVILPNNFSITVTHVGSILLNDNLILHDVLYVPQFQFNLLSITSLTKCFSCSVYFVSDSCQIQDINQAKVIGMGKRVGNLYVLRKFEDVSSPLVCNTSSDLSHLWHSRLGHPAFVKLSILHQQLGSSFTHNTHVPCSICHLSKQKRLPFISHNNVCDASFQLLHLDVWGPFTPVSVEGHKYFLTIVDDHSRFTWVYMLKNKSDVQHIFSFFYQMITTQFGVKIKGVRSDNAPELNFTTFFNQNGIIHYRSCVEKPQQNSVVERKHQHILNVARALLFQSNMPLVYWTYCVSTAVYLINRIPSTFLKNKTPFELLHLKPPSYIHLKVFGCLCYASTLASSRDKISPRAIKSVFMGYPQGYKGYKLLNLETNDFFISRDVIFHEHSFPFKDVSVISIPLDIFSDSVLPAHISSSNISPNLPKHTRSNRVTHAPHHLRDYHCFTTTSIFPSTTAHPLSTYLSSHRLSPSFSALVNNISSVLEPEHYSQAVAFPEWKQAMVDELSALETSGTWSIVSLPKGKSAIGCRWVYKTKFSADGSLQRYKARLVAKGYTQLEGIDYLETFSPVAKLVTVKVLLALAAAQGWFLLQLDVNNAFLHGDLSEEVYMTLPPGYCREGEILPPHAVCKLHKSIYGLKQASRQWFAKFSTALLDIGFLQSHADNSLFLRTRGGAFVALLVYVDDIVIATNCEKEAHELKTYLDSRFRLKDLGELKYFLGIEVARSQHGISICQRNYSLNCSLKLDFLAVNRGLHLWMQIYNFLLMMGS